jgi:hypothetical protein
LSTSDGISAWCAGPPKPDADRAGVNERGQREGRRHLHVLRHQQHLPPIVAVGHDAADDSEEQDGQLAEKRVEAEVEGRR